MKSTPLNCLALIVPVFIAGCMVGPDYKAPHADAPPA